jgi:homoserine dehydrogenase
MSLVDLLEAFRKRGRFSRENPHFTDMSPLEACRELDYDVLVELSTLSIEGRGEPARSHIRAALERGRHVVTANKGPVGFAFRELEELAAEKGCRFLYESSVMDGAPVFNLARSSLRGARVTAFSGILNGTTNYVLARMEQGDSLDEGVCGAVEAGIAEADPSHDIEGWDAAAKTAALANVLMNADITPLEVEREGIAGVTGERIESARERGMRLKLICRGWREKGRVRARVAVEEVPREDPFALVSHFGAALRLETDLMHPLILTQECPDLYDTAYGVLNDLMELDQTENNQIQGGK